MKSQPYPTNKARILDDVNEDRKQIAGPDTQAARRGIGRQLSAAAVTDSVIRFRMRTITRLEELRELSKDTRATVARICGNSAKDAKGRAA